MNKHKKLSVFENLIWNTVGSFTYLFCQWLLTMIVVRVSGNMENAGRFSLAISIANIFQTVACFNVRPYLVSDIKGKYQAGEYSAFRITTIGLSAIICGCYLSIFHYSSEQLLCIALYLVFKSGEVWVDLLHGFEQRKSRMDLGGISLFVRGILSLVSFGVTLAVTDNLNLSIVMMAACTLIFVVMFDCQVAIKFENYMPKISWKKWIKMFMEFIPLTIGSFLSNLGANLPRQMLEEQKGSSGLGIYSTVATPAVIVQVAATYVFNPLLTRFAQLYDDNKIKEFVKMLIKVCVVLLGISLVCICGASLLGEWGLGLLYGSKIKKYSYLFVPVIYYTCCNAFVWFFWNILIVMRRLKVSLVINVLGFMINILIMNNMLVKYDMQGVNYTLITYCVSMIVMMLSTIIFTLMRRSRKNT